MVYENPNEPWSIGVHGTSQEGFWLYYTTYGTPVHKMIRISWLAIGR